MSPDTRYLGPLAAVIGLLVGVSLDRAMLSLRPPSPAPSCPATPPPVVDALHLPDGGSPLELATGLRREPLRVCWWSQNALSGNASPEQCITDAALHRLELGLPTGPEPRPQSAPGGGRL